jgi:hypothetical protein
MKSTSSQIRFLRKFSDVDLVSPQAKSFLLEGASIDSFEVRCEIAAFIEDFAACLDGLGFEDSDSSFVTYFAEIFLRFAEQPGIALEEETLAALMRSRSKGNEGSTRVRPDVP